MRPKAVRLHVLAIAKRDSLGEPCGTFLTDLGVTTSHSRPHNSNNPFQSFTSKHSNISNTGPSSRIVLA
jgi:hypothetical protein